MSDPAQHGLVDDAAVHAQRDQARAARTDAPRPPIQRHIGQEHLTPQANAIAAFDSCELCPHFIIKLCRVDDMQHPLASKLARSCLAKSKQYGLCEITMLKNSH